MLLRFIVVAMLLSSVPYATAAGITIDTQFPGGNVVVKGIEGDTVHLTPDLRGGQAWFYWCFDAVAAKPGKVTFAFANPLRIGVRGPAVSRDGGRSWRWLGAEHVESTKEAERFSYQFNAAQERVRFAVAIPYLQHDLDAFVLKNKNNPHLSKSVLTKTRKGTPVDLLQIGKLGPDRQSVLVTARHHACESMASYVLEGFMQEALSDSPAAAAFRKRYVLYAVPLVDKDGVQAGDQGKNRAPHDHNRDYGPEPLYPEVRTIQELVDEKDVRFSIDFHCPALRGDIHEAFHFLGLGVPHIRDNLDEFRAWIKEERPPAVMVPLNFLADPKKPNAVDRRINSHYLATREKALFAATLEVPYTQRHPALDQDMARAYGAGLLRAWVRTTFVPAGANGPRGESRHAKLEQFRTEFQKLYRGQPQQAELLVSAYQKADTPSNFRIESSVLLATLRLRQKEYAAARSLNDSVLNDANATTQQRAAATVLQVQVDCADPRSTSKDVEASFTAALRFPYSASEQLAKCYEAVAEFHRRHLEHQKAIDTTRKQIAVAANYEVGKLWNRIAADHDLLKEPADAILARKETVKALRPRLAPVPVSVFGAMMAGDLFEALRGIPDAPLAELRATGQMVLDHKITSAAMKEKVRKALAGIESK